MIYSERTVLQKILRSQYFVKSANSEDHNLMRFKKKFNLEPEEQVVFKKAEETKSLSIQLEEMKVEVANSKTTTSKTITSNINYISSVFLYQEYRYLKT